MRAVIIVFFLFILVSFSMQQNNSQALSSGPIYHNDANVNWADSILNTLTIEQKIAQLFMVAANGKNLNENHYKKVDSLILNYGIGGVIFFQSGPQQLKLLLSRYNKLSSIGLLAGIDAEWGVSMRLDSAQKFPWMMTLGAIQDEDLIYQFGNHVAQQFHKLGLHINFAPVLDINNNPYNPIIDRRSFGEDRGLVASKGFFYMQGLQDNNILACAKHFPGHGDTDTDSHLALPVINHNRERLDSIELFPFKKLIDKRLGSIMVAHLNLPKIDTLNVPSSFSKKVIQDILRNDLKFEGLVISDALNMNALFDFSNPGERELNAFLAGNDILLFPTNVPEAIALIKSKVIDNPVLEKQLNNSCHKILMCKRWAFLGNKKSDWNNTDLQSSSARLLNRQLSKHAITVLKNNQVLPLETTDSLKVACLLMGPDSGDFFYNRLNSYLPVSKYIYSSSSDSSNLFQKLDKYDLVITSLHYPDNKFWEKHNLNIGDSIFLEKLSKKNNVILNIFGHPRLLNSINVSDVQAIILSYQNSLDFQDLSAQLHYGSISATGKLPISLKQFSAGDGLFLNKSRNFQFSLPIEAGLNIDSLNKIDTLVNHAISKKIMPGCQIVVARKGKVIYQKSFGYHTYDSIVLVRDDHLYDIASITKIAATAPLLMYLYNQKSFNLNKKLKHYSTVFKNTDKGNLKMIDIFTHQARLFPWLPFYKKTLNELGELRSDLYNESYSIDFPFQVANNIYLHNNFNDSILNYIIESDLLVEKEYRYSDLGYYLIQSIIEKKIDNSIPNFLSKNFYHPIDAYRITYHPLKKFPINKIVPTEKDNYFRKQLIQGYVHDQGAALCGGVALHAGLFTNATDLMKLMQLYLDGGQYENMKLLSAKSISKFTDAPFSDSGNRRGIVFDKPSIDPKEDGPTCDSISLKSFGHSGWTGTIAWADPKEEIVYIFLSNGRAYPDGNNMSLVKENVRTDIQKIIYNSIVN